MAARKSNGTIESRKTRFFFCIGVFTYTEKTGRESGARRQDEYLNTFLVGGKYLRKCQLALIVLRV